MLVGKPELYKYLTDVETVVDADVARYITKAADEIASAPRGKGRSVEKTLEHCRAMIMEKALADAHGFFWDGRSFDQGAFAPAGDVSDPDTGATFEVKLQSDDKSYYEFRPESWDFLIRNRSRVDYLITASYVALGRLPNGNITYGVRFKQVVETSSLFLSEERSPMVSHSGRKEPGHGNHLLVDWNLAPMSGYPDKAERGVYFFNHRIIAGRDVGAYRKGKNLCA